MAGSHDQQAVTTTNKRGQCSGRTAQGHMTRKNPCMLLCYAHHDANVAMSTPISGTPDRHLLDAEGAPELRAHGERCPRQRLVDQQRVIVPRVCIVRRWQVPWWHECWRRMHLHPRSASCVITIELHTDLAQRRQHASFTAGRYP